MSALLQWDGILEAALGEVATQTTSHCAERGLLLHLLLAASSGVKRRATTSLAEAQHSEASLRRRVAELSATNAALEKSEAAAREEASHLARRLGVMHLEVCVCVCACVLYMYTVPLSCAVDRWRKMTVTTRHTRIVTVLVKHGATCFIENTEPESTGEVGFRARSRIPHSPFVHALSTLFQVLRFHVGRGA
jgi:hypothetical protein